MRAWTTERVLTSSGRSENVDYDHAATEFRLKGDMETGYWEALRFFPDRVNRNEAERWAKSLSTAPLDLIPTEDGARAVVRITSPEAIELAKKTLGITMSVSRA